MLPARHPKPAYTDHSRRRALSSILPVLFLPYRQRLPYVPLLLSAFQRLSTAYAPEKAGSDRVFPILYPAGLFPHFGSRRLLSRPTPASIPTLPSREALAPLPVRQKRSRSEAAVRCSPLSTHTVCFPCPYRQKNLPRTLPPVPELHVSALKKTGRMQTGTGRRQGTEFVFYVFCMYFFLPLYVLLLFCPVSVFRRLSDLDHIFSLYKIYSVIQVSFCFLYSKAACNTQIFSI